MPLGGHFYTAANMMPEIPNNAWGETIWYLDLSH